MIKKTLAFFTAIILITAVSGCGSASVSARATTEEKMKENVTFSASKLSGSVVITGSTSVDKIINDMTDEFAAENPDAAIDYTGSGSSAGIKDTLSGTNNIGVSSRDLKEDEKTDGLQVTVFAYDGIAIVVNPANPVKNISVADLAALYSGKISNWKELGGNDAPIFIVSREESSGTRTSFEDLIDLKGAGGLTGAAAVSEGNGPVQAAVAGNVNAIGYVSFSFMDSSVKALDLEGASPTEENAKSGDYKLSRPFLFCYFDDSASEAGKAFLDFALSPAGQAIVKENGAIPID